MDHSLVIRRSKTRAGERVIPLNANAYAAIIRLRERAQMLFGADLQPDWYVFPSAKGYSKPDPTKPMSHSMWTGKLRGRKLSRRWAVYAQAVEERAKSTPSEGAGHPWNH